MISKGLKSSSDWTSHRHVHCWLPKAKPPSSTQSGLCVGGKGPSMPFRAQRRASTLSVPLKTAGEGELTSDLSGTFIRVFYALAPLCQAPTHHSRQSSSQFATWHMKMDSSSSRAPAGLPVTPAPQPPATVGNQKGIKARIHPTTY